jgi:hypothetical protein
VDLLDKATWPADVVACLKRHKRVLLAKERRDQEHSREHRQLDRKSPAEQEAWRIRQYANQYDLRPHESALAELVTVLGRHALLGYHCTRLTEPEISRILSHGMQLPGGSMLESRIRTIQSCGLIERELAEKLVADHQADATNRKGMIWFCFYPPHPATEHGIGSLLRFWGGEALFQTWRHDASVGPALQKIGMACLVEADVPVASLSPHSWLGRHVARQFLINDGFKTNEPALHEDWAHDPILAANIRRIVRYPEPDFIRLTHCNEWELSLDTLSSPRPGRAQLSPKMWRSLRNNENSGVKA